MRRYRSGTDARSGRAAGHDASDGADGLPADTRRKQHQVQGDPGQQGPGLGQEAAYQRLQGPLPADSTNDRGHQAHEPRAEQENIVTRYRAYRTGEGGVAESDDAGALLSVYTAIGGVEAFA